MKSVAVVVGLFAMLAVHVTAGLDVSNALKTIEKCKTKTGISDENLLKMKKDFVPQTDVELCYAACLNHEFGTVFPNNTINVEQVKELHSFQKEKDPDAYQKAAKAAEICAPKIAANSDDCAAAKIIDQCFRDAKKNL